MICKLAPKYLHAWILCLLKMRFYIQVTDETMSPPNTDSNALQGKDNRRKLLRFWVETSAWLLDHQRRHGKHSRSLSPSC